ncbi:hypothetical protein D9757_001358 [Collybiopsis confluens]|uniref:Uncharacterized protein n=1 Tax=Collybiopsis confluens TaxID=2823264 RepID=A0A8H5HZA2_9AGAR|nr:hypothetical protein D9757_001358 [Collybiopsis confluens]
MRLYHSHLPLATYYSSLTLRHIMASTTTSAEAQTKKPNLQIDADEDLDELDDVLTEFASTTNRQTSSAAPLSPLVSPPPPPPTVTTTTSFSRPRTNTRVGSAPISVPGTGVLSSSGVAENEDAEVEAALSDEFTKELVKNMQELMKELAASAQPSGDVIEQDPEQSEDIDKEKETERLMKAAWEAMLIEGMNGMSEPAIPLEATSSAGQGKTTDFQSKIKQTMDKLKESEVNLQNSSSTSAAGPESLQGLLNSLKELGLDGEGEGNKEDEDELAGFLDNMMGHLMGKEVLYEPLKELSDKFPAYLSQPPKDVSATDMSRYKKQYEYVCKIINIFEDPSYDESHQETGAKVAELMGQMQNYGAPPESIMGPMPPGLGADGGCIVA